MNRLFYISVIIGSLFFYNSLHAQSVATIDLSSVDAFFQMADKIASGKKPTEKEWDELFATQGYKKFIAESFEERADFIRTAMNLVFNPEEIHKKDSIISIPVAEIMSDWEALLLHVTLQNFLDIKEHESAIKEQLQAINFEHLSLKAVARLKNFLINPVDSLIVSIPVSILCMEPDAFSLPGRIVWDSNSFYKYNEEQRIDLLAHEMFHAYRRHFVDESKAMQLIKLIHGWQNEGIADLIDKKSVADLSIEVINYGFPKSYMDEYNAVYTSTPQKIKELERVTLSFLHNEISEKEFNSKIACFDQFGGHPNGYFMTTQIKNAGLEKELISTFTSPLEFMKLYNKSAAEEYKLGREFMDYIEKVSP